MNDPQELINDIFPGPGDADRCDANHIEPGTIDWYLCTLHTGHTGDHEAHYAADNTDPPIATWENT